MKQRHYRLAVLPGDGIGNEVIAESLKVLEHIKKIDSGISFSLDTYDWGTEYYLKNGKMMPDDGIKQLEKGKYDGILLGPVGDPRVADHITLWGLLLPIRQQFDQYVNLRPVRLFEGVSGPLKKQAPIDIVCVRENTEGEYSGVGGRVHTGTPSEVAIQSIVFTRNGTERVMKYAFEWAQKHNRKQITSATKSNSMQHNMVFWDDVFSEVSPSYPDIHTDKQLIDSLMARLVDSPESLDVIVASNLFGDIITDLSAAITGSLGLAPSANLNPEKKFPSLFQAIHGSAPDIAGKGIANPIASIWSLQLMFDFFEEEALSTALMKAIESVLTEGKVLTKDLGGNSKTTEVGQAICAALDKFL